MRQNRAGKLVPTLLAEIRRNYQKQHSHKYPEGMEEMRHPPKSAPIKSSASVSLFECRDTQRPLALREPPLADSRNNHIPKDYVKKTSGNIPKSSLAAGWGQQGPPQSAFHPSVPPPSTWGMLKKAGIAAFTHQDEWGCLCPGTDLSRLSWHRPGRVYIRKAAPV